MAKFFLLVLMIFDFRVFGDTMDDVGSRGIVGELIEPARQWGTTRWSWGDRA
jgi:hypothetical protein